ncbi:MAG TPA: DUF6056 family protein [Kofleriaceae bacterium]|jgi:hypothetical protein
MKDGTARLLRWLFYAYVAITFVHIAYVVNHEPYSFDAWNFSHDTNARPFSIVRFFEYWHQQYTTSNPRFGQPLAYLAYKVVGVAEIGTPVAFFGIVVAGFVLGTRRWPSLRSGRDLATLAIAIGFMWFAAPELPAYMFCRAYATNYVWAIAIQLWFVVPMRLHGGNEQPPSPAKLAAYFVLGVAAGMCNEHTGPTLIVFTLGYALWQRRSAHRRSWLALIGTAGAIVGYAIIFFAPGQSQRYDAIAERYSPLQQILVRGVSGNLDIFVTLLEAVAPLLVAALVAIAIGTITEDRETDALGDARLAQRRALTFVAIALAAGTLITMTVFASPKLGWRFFMHATLLLLGAVIGVISTYLHRPRSFAPFVAVAVIASGYAIARTVPSYTRTARASHERLAQLENTQPGSVVTIDAWDQIQESWWTLGDDARDQTKRDMIATYFGLDRVLFRGGDLWKALGVTDVKLTMHYELDQPQCIDEADQLDLQPFIGRDVAAIQHAFLDGIAEIERTLHTKVKTMDLTATFLGERPPMPRDKLYLARWANNVLEGYTASIKRSGRTSVRQVVLSPSLDNSDWEIYAVAIGDPPRDLGSSTSGKPLTYEPWRNGTYWLLACKPDYCFVVFATSHVI